MVLIEKLWDDVMAGPQPDKGLGKLRKSITVQTTGTFFVFFLNFMSRIIQDLKFIGTRAITSKYTIDN